LRRDWVALLLLALVALAYGSGLANGFACDDLRVIVKGRVIGDLRNLPALFVHDAMWNSVGDAFARTSSVDTYRPLPLATFAVERALFGLWAPGYHATSVSLHAANVFLLFVLAQRLGLGRGGAAAAAALFAVHPSLHEAVHWINGRSDPLAVLFILAATLAWLPFAEARARGEASRLGRATAVTSLVFLGTLAKEITFMVTPALVLLAPRVAAAPRPGAPRPPLLDRRFLGTAAPLALGLALGLAARLLVLRGAAAGTGAQAGHALARLPALWLDGLRSLLVPVAEIRTSLFEDYAMVTPGRTALALVTVALLISAAVWAHRRGAPLPAWALSTFLLALAPIAMLTSFDGWAGWGRYLYPTGPAFAVAMVSAVEALLWPRLRPSGRQAVGIAAGAAVLVLALDTRAAARFWVDERAFNLAQIEHAPRSAVGYYQLGSLEVDQGNLPVGLRLLEEALARNPRHREALTRRAWVLLAQGRLDEALGAANDARTVAKDDPVARFVEASVRLGRGEQEAAAAVLLPLLAEDPDARGLWREVQKALGRFGSASPFAAAVRDTAGADRFPALTPRLRALLSTAQPSAAQASPLPLRPRGPPSPP
jgi:tetratricopeptide (TPR) repeat protein